MKLFIVGASPFARKVRAAAEQLHLSNGIEIVIANPHERPPELLMHNPLSKIPTLVDDFGNVHTDSYAICEYLDSLSSRFDLIPQTGRQRHDVQFRHALAHGVMECAVIRRVESLKAEDGDRAAWMKRQELTIGRVLNWFEDDAKLDGPSTLDRLTLGAALGFLDFRFPDDGWREERPRLAKWFEAYEKTPPMALTQPFE